jgi:calcineurin-like phosphoesterase family protein
MKFPKRGRGARGLADQGKLSRDAMRLSGYQNVKDMDDEMIRLWNECVTPEDYHLGDFAYGRKRANPEPA